MSDVSQGLGWWQASDGRWYPPHLHPSRRDTPPAAGWWRASDGRWYPPHLHPAAAAPAEASPVATATAPAGPVIIAIPPVRSDSSIDGAAGRRDGAGPGWESAPYGRVGGGGPWEAGPEGALPAGAPGHGAAWAMVLAIVCWPAGIVAAHRARRRARQAGGADGGLATAAMAVAYGLAVVTAVLVAVHVSGHRTTATGSQAPAAPAPTGQGLADSASRRVAQTDLSTALAEARSLYAEDGAFPDTASFAAALASSEPDLHFTAGPATASGSISIEVTSSSELYLAATATRTSTCWLVRDAEGGAVHGVSYSAYPVGSSACSAAAGPGISSGDWHGTFPG